MPKNDYLDALPFTRELSLEPLIEKLEERADSGTCPWARHARSVVEQSMADSIRKQLEESLGSGNVKVHIETKIDGDMGQ